MIINVRSSQSPTIGCVIQRPANASRHMIAVAKINKLLENRMAPKLTKIKFPKIRYCSFWV